MDAEQVAESIYDRANAVPGIGTTKKKQPTKKEIEIQQSLRETYLCFVAVEAEINLKADDSVVLEKIKRAEEKLLQLKRHFKREV